MELTFIRNATMILDYAGKRILADPYFSEKHQTRSFVGGPGNPMVDLPLPAEQIIEGVEMVLNSHLHGDHFDKVAQEMLDKSLPVFCQPNEDDKVREWGFSDVTAVSDAVEWEGIKIDRIEVHHGLGEVEEQMGRGSGYILRAEGEPTVLWCGDSVLCDEIKGAIKDFTPDVIITHSSASKWALDSGEKVLIVMDAEQTIETAKLAPEATVVAIHMECLDHMTQTRDDLRTYATDEGIDNKRLRIPADGEKLTLS